MDTENEKACWLCAGAGEIKTTAPDGQQVTVPCSPCMLARMERDLFSEAGESHGRFEWVPAGSRGRGEPVGEVQPLLHISWPEGRKMETRNVAFVDKGLDPGTKLYAESPAPAAVPEHERADALEAFIDRFIGTAESVARVRAATSYSDSYFGERPGAFKESLAELDHTISAYRAYQRGSYNPLRGSAPEPSTSGSKE